MEGKSTGRREGREIGRNQEKMERKRKRRRQRGNRGRKAEREGREGPKGTERKNEWMDYMFKSA